MWLGEYIMLLHLNVAIRFQTIHGYFRFILRAKLIYLAYQYKTNTSKKAFNLFTNIFIKLLRMCISFIFRIDFHIKLV